MGIVTGLSPLPSVSLSLCPVWVSCGKMADWSWMPFGVVSGVSQGMGVLDGGAISTLDLCQGEVSNLGVDV